MFMYTLLTREDFKFFIVTGHFDKALLSKVNINIFVGIEFCTSL